MPNLLLQYFKEYNQLLKTYLKSFEALEKISNETHFKPFLDEQKNVLSRHVDLGLNLVLVMERLESLSDKIKDLPKPETVTEPIELEKLNKKIEQLTSQKQKANAEFTNITTELKEISDKFPWINLKLGSKSIPEDQKAFFEKYMDAYNKMDALHEKLATKQVEIKVAISISQDPDDKKKAMDWSRENNGKMREKASQLESRFLMGSDYKLYQAYTRSTKEHKNYIKKPDIHASLEDLERLALDKKSKHENYLKMLPDYVAKEIPANMRIKGKKGLFQTKTKEKINIINRLLSSSNDLKNDKQHAELKDAFQKIGIDFTDDQIKKIRTKALKKTEPIKDNEVKDNKETVPIETKSQMEQWPGIENKRKIHISEKKFHHQREEQDIETMGVIYMDWYLTAREDGISPKEARLEAKLYKQTYDIAIEQKKSPDQAHSEAKTSIEQYRHQKEDISTPDLKDAQLEQEMKRTSETKKEHQESKPQSNEIKTSTPELSEEELAQAIKDAEALREHKQKINPAMLPVVELKIPGVTSTATLTSAASSNSEQEIIQPTRPRRGS